MQRMAFMEAKVAAVVVASMLAGLTGCSSVPVMGTVRSAPACAPDEAATADLPLFRALVVVACDDGQVFAAETDRAGRFTSAAGRPIPLGCRLRVTRPGYEARTYAIADVCAVSSDGACSAISVSARLSPRREPEVTLAPGLRPADKQTIAGLR